MKQILKTERNENKKLFNNTHEIEMIFDKEKNRRESK